MKRNMELVLKILEHYEARESVSIDRNPQIPGYDENVVAYHIRRMYEGGLLDAETVTSTTTKTRLIDVYPFGITWQGHEFLDAMRQQGVGSQVRKKLGSTLSNVPFTIIKELALFIARQQVGLL